MPEAKTSFDLTNKDGVATAMKTLVNQWKWQLFPVVMIAKTILDLVKNAMKPTIQQQQELALDLIKAGKEQGVDEMEVMVDDQAVVGLELPFNQAGQEIVLGAKVKDKVRIRVKYK